MGDKSKGSLNENPLPQRVRGANTSLLKSHIAIRASFKLSVTQGNTSK